jgi:glycosyltransferase involved in cell wall biosynthesis
VLAAKDRRITLVPKTNLSDAVQEYRKLSLLAVPSVWMETGPLTLMEALAAGVPVYGSNRVGQVKLLREQGKVIEPNTVESWHQALKAAYTSYQTGLWPLEMKRARGTGAMRTMDTVSSEMIKIYREALNLSVE